MLCDAHTAVWGRELDNGGTSVAKVGVLPGWSSEEDAQMTQTWLKHCCSLCNRCLDNKIQGSDSEVEIPPEIDEE